MEISQESWWERCERSRFWKEIGEAGESLSRIATKTQPHSRSTVININKRRCQAKKPGRIKKVGRKAVERSLWRNGASEAFEGLGVRNEKGGCVLHRYQKAFPQKMPIPQNEKIQIYLACCSTVKALEQFVSNVQYPSMAVAAKTRWSCRISRVVTETYDRNTTKQ